MMGEPCQSYTIEKRVMTRPWVTRDAVLPAGHGANLLLRNLGKLGPLLMLWDTWRQNTHPLPVPLLFSGKGLGTPGHHALLSLPLMVCCLAS